MPEEFDPYRKWLGIPPKDQPPNHYRLLGIAPFEDDPDVIENAANRQMSHVRTFQSGKQGPISQRILNELTTAKLCLLQAPKKKIYDEELRRSLAAAGQLSSADGAVEAAVEDGPDFPPPPPTDFRGSEGRWRTSSEQVPPPSPGPAPVPIPMPPAVPPPVGLAVPSMPSVSSGRRTSYASASTKSRKSSSAMPMLLIVGAVGLLALVGIVALIASSQSNPPKGHSGSNKPPGSAPEHDKIAKRPPVPVTPAPVVPTPRPPRPQPPPKSQPVVSRPSLPNSTDPIVESDPKTELTKARQALAHRKDDDFPFHLGQTEYLIGQQKPANADELKVEIEHLRELGKQVSKFWDTVRDGALKKIPTGVKVQFPRHELELVSHEGDQLKYKFDNVEHVAHIKKLPAKIAMFVALRTFGVDNLEGKIAIVLFQRVDSEAANDESCQRLARRLLRDIDAAGVSDNPLLKRERGKTPESVPAGEDLAEPLILGGDKSKPNSSTPDSKTSTTSEPKKLDSQLVKEAGEKFQKEFREKLSEAKDKLAPTNQLFTEMMELAAKEEGVEYKIKLLKEACGLAAELGMSDKIAEAADEIEKLSGESSFALQVQFFKRIKLELPGKAKELLNLAQAAAVQAQSQGDLFHAVELLKIAKTAAEKAKLTTESQALQEKIQEVEKARAEKK